MRIYKSEAGQVLVLTTLSMMLLLGFAGLAVDVGMLFHAKRNVQIAADAAALAGAIDYKYYASASSAIAAAQNAASANGVTDTSDLTVNVPPLSGPNTGSRGFIEAIVSVPNPTWFMRLFGFNSVNVGARAVAGDPSPGTACVYVLDPLAQEAMNVQGSFMINAPGCGVVVDSKASNALYFGGTSGQLIAAWVSVVGGDSGQISDSTPTPVTGGAPVSDPIDITGPTPTNSGCAGGDGYPGEAGSTDNTTTTLTGDLSAGGPGSGQAICFTQPVTLSNVTLGTGIYVFENGVTLNGGTIRSGPGGTTLDVYSGSFITKTNTTLDITAPTTGETANIAIMETPGNTSTVNFQIGNLTGNIFGVIYAPTAELLINDSGGDTGGGLLFTSDFIVGTFYEKTAYLNLTDYSSMVPWSRLKRITLVE